MSLTTLLIPTYINMLEALSGWLKKGEAETGDPAALLAARLAPDMFPLATQVRFVCLQAQEAVYRLRGEPIPERLTALGQEGLAAADRPGTMADAKARLDEALAWLRGLQGDELDSGAARDVSIEVAGGMIFDMNGEAYARDWALPQFYFHTMTAYAILRSEGVRLGKADYVPHALAYLRPGSGPQG